MEQNQKPKPAACEACGASDDIKRFPILGFASCRDRDACLERVRAKDAPAVEPEQPTREDGLTRAIEAIRQDAMRDAERRIVEWLRERDDGVSYDGMYGRLADAIERGEHRG